ncbi:MAG: hypothetical protein K8J08_09425 [Thermoanaerobaculia bacterium]|nr:hypothetical protein [Thermoanaerobaculia bacterium]
MSEESESTSDPLAVAESTDGAPRESASRFSDLHSRTFEMELLVSGAVVFALIQIPPRLQSWFESVNMATEGSLRLFGVYGYTYAALMLYTLIVFFVLHLGLRAFWIGLVGMESVFPEGIDWEKVSLGPFARRHHRAKLPSLRQQIERLDDLCSLTFSFAFIIVLSFLYSIAVILLAGIIGFALSRALGQRVNLVWIFFCSLALLMVPQMLVTLVDKHFGERIDENGRAGRWINRILRWTYPMSPIGLIGQIQFTLQSRIQSGRTTLWTLITIALLSVTLILVMFVSFGVIRFDNLERFPDNLDTFGLEAEDYRDQSPPERRSVRQPTIQSDVIKDPFVKLLVPYYPNRHNDLLRRACPKVSAIQASPLRFLDIGTPDAEAIELTRRNIECLSSLFRVTLDGKALTPIEWIPARTGMTRSVGLMAYLATDGLSSGRHNLVVRYPRDEAQLAPDQDQEPFLFAEDPSDRIFHLPFWR